MLAFESGFRFRLSRHETQFMECKFSNNWNTNNKEVGQHGGIIQVCNP